MDASTVRDDLYVCARSGDLQRVQYLVEVQGQSVNQINEWQASPLFYACLAGHTATVKYLLEQGARCEANTFDGERCHYAALTPEIRTLLKEFKTVVRATDAFSEFMLKIFNRADCFADISFDVNGEEKIVAHRAILAAWSAYMREQIVAGRWRKTEIRFRNAALRPVAWKAVLRALYCGHTEVPRDLVQTALMICRQCKLGALADALLEADVNCEGPWIRASLHPLGAPSVDECTELQRNLALLARAAVPRDYQGGIPVRGPSAAPLAAAPAASGAGGDLLASSVEGVPHAPAEAPAEGEELERWLADLRELSDVVFVVDSEKFFCHRVFMLRCEYFKAMLSGGFREAGGDGAGPLVIPLKDISAPVFAIIVEYIYTDRVQRLLSIDSALLHDVLRVADLFLLTGLKTLCATYITQHVTTDNVFELYRTAVLYELPRLEESTTLHMAMHIEEVVRAPEFAALMRESAATIKDRQGVDSLPLADEMRSHLAAAYGARFQLNPGEELDEYEAARAATLDYKRGLIDALLAQLGIGALNRLGRRPE